MIGIKAKITKEGDLWLISIPAIDAVTQAHTRDELFPMLEDYIKEASEIEGIEFDYRDNGAHDVDVFLSPEKKIIPWLLGEFRENADVTLEEAAKRLNVKGKNAYKRYQDGESVPSISKFSELLEVTGKRLMIG
ncbi:MAG: helix-turn-helix transcriptional regulator [Pseudobacteriovorax sp.]|nr:helix-turn-helix transcriptional regulator [Pseudobacteriovorax sp.]